MLYARVCIDSTEDAMLNCMAMKRRRFMQAIAAVPAGAPVLAQTQPNQQPAPTTAPVQGPVVGQVPLEGQRAPVLKTVISEAAATPVPTFFSPEQYATLCRLCDLFMPPLNGNPGALEAATPEFLDFYNSVSDPGRQKLYTDGLNDLNTQAKSRFKKSFATLSNNEADTILKPLFKPRGPLQAFLDLGPFANRALQDIRTVTLNSPAWAAHTAASGRRIPAPLYWEKVDPSVLR
jgi:hypothetical protein